MREHRPPVARPVIVVATVGAALLAITTATALATISGPTSANPLTGRIWVLATLGGKAPLTGTKLTVEFTPAMRASGSAGCNRFMGSYRVSGTSIRISAAATTMKGCTAPIARQETAFLNALSRARSFAVRGRTMTLRSSGGRSLATFRAQSQVLTGTSWEVLAFNNGKQAVVSVLTGTELTAVFGRGGQLTGFAGCNDYKATFRAVPPRLSIGPVAATRKHCEEPAGVGEQEMQYLAALETAATYRVEGSQLEIRTADGALAVQLRRT